jgi:hypothetical protein
LSRKREGETPSPLNAYFPFGIDDVLSPVLLWQVNVPPKLKIAQTSTSKNVRHFIQDPSISDCDDDRRYGRVCWSYR